MNSQQSSTINVRGVEVDIPELLVVRAQQASIQRQLKRGINWAIRQITDRYYEVVSFEVQGSGIPDDYPRTLYLVFHEGAFIVREPK